MLSTCHTLPWRATRGSLAPGAERRLSKLVSLSAALASQWSAWQTCPAAWQVTTSKQRDTFLASLAGDEDWLYSSEGEVQQAPAFRCALQRASSTGALCSTLSNNP